MAKRSRSERRTHQQEQAIATGDVASLKALAEKGTTSIVPALVRALGAQQSDPARAAELDAFALQLGRKLRRSGDPAHALTIAAAGHRRSPAWRMEEALAAFASGHDDVAADIASTDATVAQALGPMLQAVRGEVAAASTAAASDLRALHAAARAVAHIVCGEPDKAKAIVRRVSIADRKSALVNEISAAADLHVTARAPAALELLRAAPTVTAEARRWMTAEAILDAEALNRLSPALLGDPVLGGRQLRARFEHAKSPGAVAEIIRSVGPFAVDAFDAKDRASAALYHGFSLLRADPAAASRSFDRAVQLGADLIEALRGKLLVSLAMGTSCPVHGHDGRRAVRDAATAADRLAHALERIPLGGPLAAAAGNLAAERWLDAEEGRHAIASIARARRLAGGKLLDELDLKEADATAFHDRSAAGRLVDALLARSPGYVDAWKLKSDLAIACGDEERADAILVEAAAVTKDPELLEKAREIQADLGVLVAFQGLVPGAVSAGILAKELARATTPEIDAYPLAAAHRKELGPAARLAFDGAAIAIADHFGSQEMAEDRLEELVQAWHHAPRDLARLIGLSIGLGLAHAIPLATLRIHDDAAAMRAITEVLASAGERELVKLLLPKFAGSLTRAELTLFKSIVTRKQRVRFDNVPTPAEALLELDTTLAPEFSIVDSIAGTVEMRRAKKSPSLDLLDLPLDDGDALESLFDMLGLPAEMLDALPKEARRKLAQKLIKFASGPRTPARMMELISILSEIGFAPPGMEERRPRRKR